MFISSSGNWITLTTSLETNKNMVEEMIKKILGSYSTPNLNELKEKINELIEYINVREKKEENRITQHQNNTGWYEVL